ncbi:hypothetical protein ABIA15_004391 [Sinorhizobium fredii]
MVKVVSIDQPAEAEQHRLGFMVGQIVVPDDFNRMGGDEIEDLFGA